jgi:3-oxoadipate enol-lactonase
MLKRILLILSTLLIAPGLQARQATPALDSGFVDVEGGKIFYEATGRGPVIVMTHDGILHRETWNAQFSALAGQYRLIRWDRRGYGKSPAATEPFSHLDDLLALTKALKVEHATFMGCSAGSLITQYFALAHPELVTSLVLVGPITSGAQFSDHFRVRGDRGQPGEGATPEQTVDYWTKTDPWIMAAESAQGRSTMRSLLTANPQDLKASSAPAIWPKESALPRLGEIKVPTLIIVGEADIPDVHAHSGAIQAAIPGAKRIVLTHSGHLPQVEVPDAFNRAVLDFLRQP